MVDTTEPDFYMGSNIISVLPKYSDVEININHGIRVGIELVRS